MTLPTATPSWRINYNPSDQSYETIDVATNSIVYRQYPISPNSSILGFYTFGKPTSAAGVTFSDFTTPNIVTITSGISRNSKLFVFTTMQARFSGGTPPFNLTSIKINDQEILSASVVISANNVFFPVTLLASSYSVPNNSLWSYTDSDGFTFTMDAQFT